MSALPLLVENNANIGNFNIVYFYSFEVVRLERIPTWWILSPTLTTAKH